MPSHTPRPVDQAPRGGAARPVGENSLSAEQHRRLIDTPTSRRRLLGMAALGGAGLVAGASSAHAHDAQRKPPGSNGKTFRLTVLGTTDLHGNVYNWNYFNNAAYSDRSGNAIGIAKASTLIKAERAERGADTCITLDAGDIIQGTPLAYYYAKVEPITEGAQHPMATAMNAVGYTAVALGNHEYNYGLPLLRAFEKQLNAPLLSANSVDWTTGAPVFRPWVIHEVKITGQKPIKVGILGLVTPGVAIWDRANVEGKVRFPGVVEQARLMVPRLKKAGADIVVVSAHSGPVTSSSYGDALPYPENASALLAEQVPGIDAILVGHAHLEVPERFVTNTVTGRQVLLSEPLYWGMRVSVMELDLQKIRGQWQVVSSRSHLLNANTAPEDPQVVALLQPAHEKVLAYVNSVIGRSLAAMSAATSRYQDTPAIDFINHVQGQAVRSALAGTENVQLPVLSIAAPFNRAAAIPQGEVTVRDVAGLYIYDNTLMAIVLTGAQVRDYLEQSATYFKQVNGAGPFAPDDLTNAPTLLAPNGTPDYNYDIMAGLDQPLTYDIDVSAPVGSRIRSLSYGGVPIDPTQEFVVAINNYRQSGGGSFPHVTGAPVVYNQRVEIRQLLIDWVTEHGLIDPAEFASTDWRLVFGYTPVSVVDPTA